MCRVVPGGGRRSSWLPVRLMCGLVDGSLFSASGPPETRGQGHRMSARPGRYLMAVWDGGGDARPQLGVGRRLVERGHPVHVLGDPRWPAGRSGGVHLFTVATRHGADGNGRLRDARNDWVTEEPLDVVREVRDLLQSGTAAAFAADTSAAITTFQPDAVVPDSQLFGAMIAAEEAASLLRRSSRTSGWPRRRVPATLGSSGSSTVWSNGVCPISTRPGPSTVCRRSPTLRPAFGLGPDPCAQQ